MNTVHSISIDAKRRLYVADRANSRIQVFDENGQFLDVWPNIKRPYYTMMSQDQHLWIADGITQKFLKFDLNGRLIPSATWGTFGAFPGRVLGRPSVPRRQRRQPLHRGRSRRPPAEVHAQARRGQGPSHRADVQGHRRALNRNASPSLW